MIGTNVKVTFNRKLTMSLPNRLAASQIGAKAFEMIRDRISKKGLLGDGRPLPKPASRTWYTPVDDPRFPPSSGDVVKKHLRTIDGKRVEMRVFESYTEAKKAAGHGAGRFGELTGSLWRSATVLVTTRRNEDLIIVGFGGSSIGTGTKTTKAGKVKAQKVPNRDKAAMLQRINADGSRADKAQFALMSLTDAEMAILTQMVLRYVQVFSR